MDEEEIVLVFAQDLVDEAETGAALGVEHAALAHAGVDQEPDGERKVRLAGEVGDGLRAAVFEDGEIVLGEVADDLAVFREHVRQDVDYFHVRGKGGDVLAGDECIRPEKAGGSEGELAPGKAARRERIKCLQGDS